MGCDIHIFVERKNKNTDKWEEFTEDHFTLDDFDKKYLKKEKGNKPFDWRNYSMFAFFAGVRNYDHCTPLAVPKGVPTNLSEEVRGQLWEDDGHSESYLTLRELKEFDYDKEFWNRRVTKQLSENSWTGAGLAEEGERKVMTYRKNLGELYFTHLEELSQLGNLDDVRIVFFFDN
jgi:hypothetical protein